MLSKQAQNDIFDLIENQVRKLVGNEDGVELLHVYNNIEEFYDENKQGDVGQNNSLSMLLEDVKSLDKKKEIQQLSSKNYGSSRVEFNTGKKLEIFEQIVKTFNSQLQRLSNWKQQNEEKLASTLTKVGELKKVFEMEKIKGEKCQELLPMYKKAYEKYKTNAKLLKKKLTQIEATLKKNEVQFQKKQKDSQRMESILRENLNQKMSSNQEIQRINEQLLQQNTYLTKRVNQLQDSLQKHEKYIEILKSNQVLNDGDSFNEISVNSSALYEYRPRTYNPPQQEQSSKQPEIKASSFYNKPPTYYQSNCNSNNISQQQQFLNQSQISMQRYLIEQTSPSPIYQPQNSSFYRKGSSPAVLRDSTQKTGGYLFNQPNFSNSILEYHGLNHNQHSSNNYNNNNTQRKYSKQIIDRSISSSSNQVSMFNPSQQRSQQKYSQNSTLLKSHHPYHQYHQHQKSPSVNVIMSPLNREFNRELQQFQSIAKHQEQQHQQLNSTVPNIQRSDLDSSVGSSGQTSPFGRAFIPSTVKKTYLRQNDNNQIINQLDQSQFSGNCDIASNKNEEEELILSGDQESQYKALPLTALSVSDGFNNQENIEDDDNICNEEVDRITMGRINQTKKMSEYDGNQKEYVVSRNNNNNMIQEKENYQTFAGQQINSQIYVYNDDEDLQDSPTLTKRVLENKNKNIQIKVFQQESNKNLSKDIKKTQRKSQQLLILSDEGKNIVVQENCFGYNNDHDDSGVLQAESSETAGKREVKTPQLSSPAFQKQNKLVSLSGGEGGNLQQITKQLSQSITNLDKQLLTLKQEFQNEAKIFQDEESSSLDNKK